MSLIFSTNVSKPKLDNLTTSSDSARNYNDVNAGGFFVAYNLGNGLILNTNLSAGQVQMDSTQMRGATRLAYHANIDFWSVGVGLTQVLPLNDTATLMLSARYLACWSRLHGLWRSWLALGGKKARLHDCRRAPAIT